MPQTAPVNHLYFTGILGLAISKDKRFLITKRNQPDTPLIHCKWQVPGGGVEFSEQPLETLTREMEEELSVTAVPIFPYPIAKTQVWQTKTHQEHLTLLCYIVTIGRQVPKIKDPESLEWKWMSKADVYGIKYLPLTIDFIDEATKICNQYSLWSQGSMIQ